MTKYLLLAIIAVVSLQSHAVPITYSWDVTGASGSLGGIAFNNADLSVDIFGDTDDVEPGTFNRYFNRDLTGGFVLEGFGSGLFTVPLNVYKSNSVIGFNGGGSDFVYLIGSFTYFLDSEFGPVAGSAGEQNVSLMTDLGAFSLTSVEGTGAFQAQFPQDPGPTPVPEPASFVLLLGGLGAFAAFRRKGNPPKF